METQPRLVGVKILGWYLIISAIIYFIQLLIMAFTTAPINANILNYFMPVYWIGMFFVGRGLLRLKEWARLICLLMYGLIFALLLFLWIRYGFVLAQAIIIAISIGIIFYLSRPRVKEQFK